MNTSLVSDKLLIKSFIQGDHSSFTKLLEKYRRKVYSYILVSVKDSDVADDLFQETFVKVITTLKSGSYKEEGKFIQWVMRIAHNQIIDYFRRGRRFPIVQEEDDYDIFGVIARDDQNVEEEMITEQINSTLRELIELLPDEQKEVLKMRIFYNFSFKEIAEETDVSINTALGRMRYALINLRKFIKDKESLLIP